MTKKAFKLMLSIHARSTCIFIGIYTLIMSIILISFSFTNIYDSFWISDSIKYTLNIYLLIMGIVYPLITTKLYVSRGLTRKQFFEAYTGAMSIIAMFLLIPILVTDFYYDNISLVSIVTHYLNMIIFFLMGWTCAVGFQIGKWYTGILGILSTITMFYIIIVINEILVLSDLSILGLMLLIVIAVLLILPRVISQIQFKV